MDVRTIRNLRGFFRIFVTDKRGRKRRSENYRLLAKNFRRIWDAPFSLTIFGEPLFPNDLGGHLRRSRSMAKGRAFSRSALSYGSQRRKLASCQSPCSLASPTSHGNASLRAVEIFLPVSRNAGSALASKKVERQESRSVGGPPMVEEAVWFWFEKGCGNEVSAEKGEAKCCGR